MCGFIGLIDAKLPKDEGLRIVAGMRDTLAHRGPDDSGSWADERTHVYLGFRRLAILDLTREGHQPMVSASGRSTLVFNGEIYNYDELRSELSASGHTFRGRSDTEVLLESVERFGIEATLQRCAGMFAFAFWDGPSQSLYLARDRLGEKPLYYGWIGSSFVFGSELKAFAAHPQWRPEIDPSAVALYLRYKYIPAPYSIYRGIMKLPAGCCLQLPRQVQHALPEPRCYWSLEDAVRRGRQAPFTGSPEDAVSELESLLSRVVAQEMIADVPLGAFLSGGIDSSTIAALMQAQSSRKVKTFTIGFQEEGYNEAEHARAVALHLQTEHTELYVTAADALNLVPRLASIWDEPFSDSSQIPTYLLAKLTREHVTVALSGDGGDELFAGYSRYEKAARIHQRLSKIPPGARRAALAALPLAAPFARWGGERWQHRMELFGRFLEASTDEALYTSLLAGWRDPERLVRGGSALPPVAAPAVPGLSIYDRMQYFDSKYYLPDDVMVKVDRATMAVSLESRAPLLDHRIVELSWRLPLEYKRRDGQSKWILRQLLARHVPRPLFERPKKGFSVPIAQWLSGPLREWAEGLLAPAALRAQGILEPAPITAAWNAHLRGSRSLEPELWSVLMLCAWMDSVKPNPSTRSTSELTAAA